LGNTGKVRSSDPLQSGGTTTKKCILHILVCRFQFAMREKKNFLIFLRLGVDFFDFL